MSLIDRVNQIISGYEYVGLRKRPGWRGEAPFYRWRCPKHGIVENYPHGFKKILVCPKCDEERRKNRE